ncbi:AAA family ATPase [Dictyobacter aurantiacus]|uniref:Clp R domain-containing protein n=1 Tax=Dictyobacter aurantiacus TaxID=1936993 RepID=A0A401ZNW5_9CHLR|nr:AAA family ATPase [Dictyobacter aurantiacus]GCE08436.1 hypothetical protein KDAU_57650 [Dictyobacter aurantiacus]
MVEIIQEQEHVALAPEIDAVIEGARREAARMQAPEYHPEHLLLSILRLKDDKIEEIFSLLGMDMRALRRTAADIVGRGGEQVAGDSALPPSAAAQDCLDWAMNFATQRRCLQVRPDHMTLAVLRHPQVQPMLALLHSPSDAIPSYLIEESGVAYTNTMDQLIQARVREYKRSGRHSSNLPIIKCERPTVTFADIQGASATKQELRHLVNYLRWSQLYQRAHVVDIDETLLIGHPCTERSLLVQAIAGEAGISMVSLSLPRLVDLINAQVNGRVDEDDLAWLEREYPTFERSDLVKTCRNMVKATFELGRHWHPCLVVIEDLDAVARFEQPEHGVVVQRQLLVELDSYDRLGSMVVVATAYQPEVLDPELMHMGHFGHHISLGERYAVHPAAQTRLCLSCKHEVLSNWTYCVYCGARLVKLCPKCGAPHVEVEGARYCFSCGSDNWSEG